MASCPTYNDVFVSPECSSADGLAAVIASCSPLYQGMEDSVNPGNCQKRLYSIFEEDAGDEEMSDEVAAHQVEKKRRLSVEQVKALEKNFEIENKLEPERKIQLARELGLQPRQVAVWFQNRRARWKTKQLEKDYDLLKSEYDDLKNSFMDLAKEKDSLQGEVARLRERLAEAGTCENIDSAIRVKVEDNSPVVKDYTPPAANYSKVEVVLEGLNSQQVGTEDFTTQLGSLNQLVACKKEGSLSSDSDASEVVEVESPRRRFDSQGHSPATGAPGVGDMSHMTAAAASFTPQQVSAFLLHEDVSYVCRGNLFPSSFAPHRSLLLKTEDDDDHQIQNQHHQQLLEDQGCQAPPFTWGWDPWA